MIRTEARELLGDLLVEATEMVRQRGDSQRWLRLASAAARAPRGPEVDDLVTSIAATIDDGILVSHWSMAARLMTSPAWEHACVFRSGLEDLRDLIGEREACDTAHLELAMLLHAPSRFAPVPIPEGTPRHHWWWFESQPPSERSLRMNAPMRELMTSTRIPPVPERFRRHFAFGLPEPGPLGMTGVLDFCLGGPADLAAQTLACVRYAAYEMRRRGMPRRRIVVHQQGLTSRLYSFAAGADVDLDVGPDLAILVMDAPD